jgi:hypothetical protein
MRVGIAVENGKEPELLVPVDERFNADWLRHGRPAGRLRAGQAAIAQLEWPRREAQRGGGPGRGGGGGTGQNRPQMNLLN